MVTRAASEKVLKHVLVKVLGQSESSPPVKAMVHNDIVSMSDLLALSKDDIYALDYEDDQGKLFPLQKGMYNRLWALKAYAIFNQRQGTAISCDEWMSVTKEMFDDFCIGSDIVTVIDQKTGKILPDPSIPSPTQASGSTQTPLENFKRGIKHDPSQFVTYKDEK